MFKITVEGSSKTTILSRDGVPIARFYAGRFDDDLLALIERRLNLSPPAPLGPTENIGSIPA